MTSRRDLASGGVKVAPLRVVEGVTAAYSQAPRDDVAHDVERLRAERGVVHAQCGDVVGQDADDLASPLDGPRHPLEPGADAGGHRAVLQRAVPVLDDVEADAADILARPGAFAAEHHVLDGDEPVLAPIDYASEPRVVAVRALLGELGRKPLRELPLRLAGGPGQHGERVRPARGRRTVGGFATSRGRRRRGGLLDARLALLERGPGA